MKNKILNQVWISDAYDLDIKEQERLVVVQTFTKKSV
jgi:hypothetical protein